MSLHLQQKRYSVLGLLVLGGNGFVGSNICKEALDRGLSPERCHFSGKQFLFVWISVGHQVPCGPCHYAVSSKLHAWKAWGFIHGIRKVPLGLIGSPLEMSLDVSRRIIFFTFELKLVLQILICCIYTYKTLDINLEYIYGLQKHTT
ncbi:hypothetical protein MKX03_024414 [Papaver bracteatum]|nr:hypothetical protein MKX03_024414 [Papaver bracteatum]